MSGHSPGVAVSCPRCGSQRLRRSAPHDGWERLVRALTPLHFYRCQECGFRGSRRGRVGSSRPVASDPSITPRPIELRDLKAAAESRKRMALLLLLAIASGIATGTLLNSCQPAFALAGF